MSVSIINIVGDAQKQRACELIQDLPLQKFVVTISMASERRSLAQNSLYWVWVTFIAGEEGLTKNEVHQRLKAEILSRIFQRDFEWFNSLVVNLRDVYKVDKVKGKQMYDGVCQLISTKMCSVDQFSEYLDDIEKDCQSRGMVLPHPEDLYDLSHNRRNS